MMATQKKKPLPGQHRKVEPLTEKVEPIVAPHPQLEVLQERMSQMATTVQVNNLHGEAMARMDKLHGVAMARMDKLHGVAMERMGQMATKAEMDTTRAEMYKLHGKAMKRMEELHSTAMKRMDFLQERVHQTAATVEVLQERTSHMPTRAEMQELHGEAMERIGRVENCMGKMESDIRLIKWIGGTLGVAIIAGLVRIIFFPVV